MFVFVIDFRSSSIVHVCRCDLFGHFQIFQSYSFGHVESVKWLFLVYHNIFYVILYKLYYISMFYLNCVPWTPWLPQTNKIKGTPFSSGLYVFWWLLRWVQIFQGCQFDDFQFQKENRLNRTKILITSLWRLHRPCLSGHWK